MYYNTLSMPMEVPQFDITRAERIKLLHQDPYYKAYLGAWKRITESPQRPEVKEWALGRRELYLTDPNPQRILSRAVMEFDRNIKG